MAHNILEQSIKLDAATRAYYDTRRQEETNTLPSEVSLLQTRNNRIATLPTTGLGFPATVSHLEHAVIPGLNLASLSPHYYGFVTGGSTPIAAVADNVVSAFDNSVQVHLPNESIVTEIEDRALRMLCQLLDLEERDWAHRTFTTGATASNVMGLACGREGVVRWHGKATAGTTTSVAKMGLVRAMNAAGLDEIQVLTTVPHSSLGKAASIVGLGRDSVTLVNRSDRPHLIDFEKLEEELKRPGVGSIVAVSCSEVNTGFFAAGRGDMERLAGLCRRYKAWIHVDAAFGFMARILAPDTNGEFKSIIDGSDGLEHAHSITGDGHKLLNVPYDCGIFLSRKAEGMDVFQNAGAAYLQTDASDIPSPLNIGIENSRRFRALPMYANLIAYGRDGFRTFLQQQIRLARRTAHYIRQHPGYELLPDWHQDHIDQHTYMVVLFRAKDEVLNASLVKAINRRKKIYVSGTVWEGQPASRIAVSNWQADEERDANVIAEALEEVYQAWQNAEGS
ncbi:PLP-dependent transferase [Eremomyces bilateralis CBS 781.70]|uniref:PLP-dependent transferase n=1 Tax=Eremomyces bilateralis CBS 781.70 TaxID=1392243 RepID=A0A6G1GI27_9PEZI|nr:PLP-dependent transferase [Eremomyces bilateralis CBS 781.70]KAF1817654.1 PLP-dependent transferase [Eremomyces bilateralis CBS 781.70]